MESHNVSIIGTGYVGLSIALGFTSKNYTAIAVERDKTKRRKICSGQLPFYEPNLKEQLRNAINTGKLCCIPTCKKAILSTDITFVAVGTPSKPNGSINLEHMEKAMQEIGEALKRKSTYHLIVVKSTVTPGTTKTLLKPILERFSGKLCGSDFGLCMSPEFMREGSALHDVQHPDRTVIGEYDKKSGDTLQVFLQDFYGENMPPVLRTNLSTAELIKYASNAFLATKISFINTIASICEKTPNVDVTAVAEGMGLDKRIGPQFLRAGLGYGGSCFPKDMKALIAYSSAMGYEPSLLNSIELVNHKQPLKAIDLCRNLLGNFKEKTVSILGLAFKPNTDDMRSAASLTIINRLLEEGANVIVYDPAATANAKTIFGDRISYSESAIQCLRNSDCCILATEWDEFKKLEQKDFVDNMRQPIVIDGRRLYDPEKFKGLQFKAIGLGTR
jgi:UDPglucose 6-dehydrogenase